MKRLFLAYVAAGLLAPGPAHADGTTYRGRCGFATMDNRTGNGVLGGGEIWTGGVWLSVVTDRGAVTAWCELKINGVSQGTVFGPVSGYGAVATAAPFQFRDPDPQDIVTLCTHVATDAGVEVECPDTAPTEFVPDPVYDAIGYFTAPANALADTAACAGLSAAAPGVDALGRPDLLDVDPTTGDIRIGPYWIWDCP